MRELIDCHIHTARCGHATGSVEECVRAAIRRKLVGIIVTEHLALPDGLDPERRLSMPPADLDDYLAEVEAARVSHPELSVVAGIETDFLPGLESQTAATVRAARERADGVRVVLGSVHFLGEWAFDDPERVVEWDDRDVDAVWSEYSDTWCAAAASGIFDVMAHPDLPKKFGHRPSGPLDGTFERMAEAARGAGVLIEVSTAGLRKPVREVYPGSALLKTFRAAGVAAVVGSDAHSPAEVGYAIEDAYSAMRSAGYEAVMFPTRDGDWRSIAL